MDNPNDITGSNLINDLHKRKLDSSLNLKFRDKYQFSRNLVDRLYLESELKGHEGCVNCLEWSQYGNLLVSGSDDLKLNIWDPFRHKLVRSVETKHRGNIFGVKFLPHSNDSLLGSCAADRDIYVYDLNRSTTLNEIHAHNSRVKRLATAQDVPFVFWSAGEDGYVIEHDIRCPQGEVSRFLLNFSGEKRESYVEAKCLSINPVRSELIAIGNNDPFARVYDRRMIKTKQCTSRTSAGSTTLNSRFSDLSHYTKPVFEFCLNDDVNEIPFTYYVPGHLPKRVEEYRKRMKTLSVTFVSFSPNGSELLVNLGGEQLYLFNLFAGSSPSPYKFKYNSYREMFDSDEAEVSTPPETAVSTEAGNLSRNSSAECLPVTEAKATKKKYKVAPKAEQLKVKANASFEEQNYVEAIEYYNRAIQIAPDSPILYGNRAAALMKRNWEGDTYMALRDCYMALNLDKNHLKSHFRLARCLHDLKWHDEAKECLDVFRKRFPDYADSQACDNLLSDVNAALASRRKKEKAAKRSETSRRKKASKARMEDEDDESDESDEPNDEYSAADAEEENDQEKRSARKKRCDSNNNTSYKKTNESGEMTDETAALAKRMHMLESKYKSAKMDAVDFKSRYCGHCNVATDIKEANFVGEDFICAGSDDGSFFIWDKASTNVVRVLKGDESIVNCIQPHPFTSMLATSGIDPHVRIWTPKFIDADSSDTERLVLDVKSAALNNQLQMNSHPFEFLLLNLTQNTQNWDQDDDSSQSQPSVSCRTS